MKPIKQLLETLIQVIRKEDRRKIKTQGVPVPHLYSLIQNYTDKPRPTFSKDESELLSMYLHNKGYTLTEHEFNAAKDLKFVKECLANLEHQEPLVCFTSSIGEIEVSYEIVNGDTHRIIETGITKQKEQLNQEQ